MIVHLLVRRIRAIEVIRNNHVSHDGFPFGCAIQRLDGLSAFVERFACFTDRRWLAVELGRSSLVATPALTFLYGEKADSEQALNILFHTFYFFASAGKRGLFG
jgi:hypothetical protein